MAPSAIAVQSSMFTPIKAYASDRSLDHFDLSIYIARSHRGQEVVDEGSLRTGVGLQDLVAKLIEGGRDALVDRVVLPVAVEDGVGIEALAVERQTLEQLRTVPLRIVLAYLERADLDGVEPKQDIEHLAEIGTVASAVEVASVDGEVGGVHPIDLVDDFLVLVGILHALTVLQVLPSPLITILMRLQTLRHKNDLCYIEWQYKILYEEREEIMEFGIPRVEDPAVGNGFPEHGMYSGAGLCAEGTHGGYIT